MIKYLGQCTRWSSIIIMAKLFIIGNGFDLAHGMKTKYSDFRQFLIDNYLNGEYMPYTFCDVPQTTLMPDGDELYNDVDVVKSILKVLDDTEGVDWNEVEDSLGCLQYSHFLDDYGEYNPEDDNYIRDTYCRNQDASKQLCGAICQINNYFQEWVKTIKIATTPKKEFMELISQQNDLFLNFNYTSTLQDLYNIKKVCHIHGTVNDKIYFGHGESYCPSEEYEKYWFGAEYSLKRLFFDLRKNAKEAFNKHKGFFNELCVIACNSTLDIYSYGFSFSRADKYYLKEICSIINTSNIRFFINDYDDEFKRKHFTDTLLECGFKGTISSFHIEEK